MDIPETRYLDRDGAEMAYQVFGEGSRNLVGLAEINQHLDLQWTDPDIHALWERIVSRNVRVVSVQRRGFGLSEPIHYNPTTEQQAADVLAIMDACGMRDATISANYGQSGPAAFIAAQAPERITGLVLVNPLANGPGAVEVPDGWTADESSAFEAAYRDVFARWGTGHTLDLWDHVLATPRNRRLMALLERCSATPGAAQSYLEWLFTCDWTEAYRSVRAPTVVLWMPTSSVPRAAVEHVASLIRGAEFRVLPQTKPGDSIGAAYVPVTDAALELTTGVARPADADRYLGTVLFTDIVSSTELLTRVGDASYRELRANHERQVREAVEDGGGRVINVVGDGTVSVFENGPTMAVRCAERICREADDDGLAVRAGVHTGELERDGINVTGLTVHLGARVGALAAPTEVWVSRTVHDLVAGSGLGFASRGEHELKGIPGRWELFAVDHAGEQEDVLPREESMKTMADKVVLHGARRLPAMSRAAMRLSNAWERRRAGAG